MRNIRVPLCLDSQGGYPMSRVMVGVLVAAVALTGTIFWEAQDPATPDLGAAPGRTALTKAVRAAPGPDTNNIMQGWVSTALARPLFREDRRPAKTADGVVLKGDAPTRLTGVITGPFGNRAIFMAAENAKPLVAKEGTRVSDFVVRSIEPGRVVVESDGMVRTLRLSFSEVAKSPGP
jgi:hypothetical protein